MTTFSSHHRQYLESAFERLTAGLSQTTGSATTRAPSHGVEAPLEAPHQDTATVAPDPISQTNTTFTESNDRKSGSDLNTQVAQHYFKALPWQAATQTEARVPSPLPHSDKQAHTDKQDAERDMSKVHILPKNSGGTESGATDTNNILVAGAKQAIQASKRAANDNNRSIPATSLTTVSSSFFQELPWHG